MIIKGKVHKLGDDINTDDIIAAKYLDSQDPNFLGDRCMENIDPSFSKKVNKGDIIVAGQNFGCGSSREHAPIAIKGSGIALVVAESFARIFFRNAINIGLPIIELKKTTKISNGDLVKADLAKGVIENKTKSKLYQTNSFPQFLQKIIAKGGLINWIKSK
ncbi:MAG: 3-isopropylmalate dehydratase small subunit [Candidatus Omnitrophica bacterium]|nr:3-isopropylmalate dehydratase small subunit [Candidatus Omnitrophota bacterium]MCF7893569.1 3-isopropylmalate dehydratase small subunit [Candidatus Omnitrophota bacterium]